MKTNNLSVAHKATGPIETQEEKKLYDVLLKLPKPDVKFKLSASQKKWWYYFGYEFVKTNQLAQLDLIHLQNAAISMDARCKLVSVINEMNKTSETGVGGWVQKFPSGATNVTGYQTMYEKATKQLDEVSAHFGLSIKDRLKLKADPGAGNQLSLFDSVVQKLIAVQ